MPQESPIIIEVGGGKLFVKVTVIGIVDEFWLPHAPRRTQVARRVNPWAIGMWRGADWAAFGALWWWQRRISRTVG